MIGPTRHTVSDSLLVLLALIAAVLSSEMRLVAQQTESEAKRIVRDRDLATQFDGGRKWAVIIGVNEYLDSAVSNLRYCVSAITPWVKQRFPAAAVLSS